MNKLPGRACALIDLQAMMHNFQEMRRQVGEDQKICAVIKTNAYGHGAVRIAQRLEDESFIWGYAVAAASEAMELRSAGIRKPILILGYVFEEDETELIRHDIRPAVFTMEMARRLSDKAQQLHKTAVIHLAVDTGMTRIGMADTEESIALACRISRLPGISIEGIFTHFARADEADKTSALNAYRRFADFTDALEHAGLRIPIRHCANSASILELPQVRLDMVRAGITVYGIYPSDEMDRQSSRLYPVMQLKSHISYIKTVPAGTPVSYGGTFVTEKNSRIATIPLGYGDGYPRSLSNRGYVLICGKKAPICGRVCMDQFMVDVTDIPEAKQHSEVTIMGEDHGVMLSVDELSRLSGRFPYEFVSLIMPRVPRIYLD